MFNVFSRPKSALVTVPAVEATAETSSDTILIERIAAGDKLAMQVLFARHRTPVYRWLYRFVGNETAAEDLLSDVFFDVWQQAGRFEGRSAVSTWLLSIARFKALSARRRRTHAELNEVIEATVADSADNAEVVLEKKHEGEMLRGALTKLSPEHREITDLVLTPRCRRSRRLGTENEEDTTPRDQRRALEVIAAAAGGAPRLDRCRCRSQFIQGT
jgi:RNA polymerase sigma-70 factor, ECF subfamily